MAAGSSGSGSNNNYRYDEGRGESEITPQTMQEVFESAKTEMNKLFEEGIPEFEITGEALVTFLWVVGAFFIVTTLLGFVFTALRYASETAVIRMVDEYETSGEKMTVRQGFRLGWSRTAWHLFLIDLIVNLPVITLMLVLLIAGLGVFFAASNGNIDFAAFSFISAIVLAFISIFVVVILTIVLYLLRNFFWRASVLEGLGVRESMQRGFAMVRENWKSVGLMWLVMFGISIVWGVASILMFIIVIPLVLVTVVIAALVSSVPYLIFVGIFSTFLSGALPWIAGGLFIAPLFFTLAFSPWLLIGSWQAVYNSTVWTLTYRELKILPIPAEVEASTVS
jgi:hypothetical protein